MCGFTIRQMLKFSGFLAVLMLMPGMVAQTQSLSGGGSLVIVGGGLETDNKAVFQEIITRAGGAEKAIFAVIPSAGGAPVQSYVWFRSELIMYGVNPANIHLIPIAMVDDDSTASVNESEWKNNGNDPELAALVIKCTGIWFTGGDQLRTVRMLYNPDGSRTEVLKAVWEVYSRGGMIGGTSAGAAIMSGVMIAAGTSLAALTGGIVTHFDGADFPEDSALFVTRGLGFFPHGVVDQHFNQRARIGRLALLVSNPPPIHGTSGNNMQNRRSKEEHRQTGPGSSSGSEKPTGSTGKEMDMSTRTDHKTIGFGIDENTAMIYDAAGARMWVAGAGGVTIVDPAMAEFVNIKGLPMIRNLQITYLEEGDAFDFMTGNVLPAPGKSPITGRERYDDPFIDQAGILAPGPKSFRELYTRDMADHKANDAIVTLTRTSGKSGFRLTLHKSVSFRGYSTTGEGTVHGYMVSGISMDIEPVRIAVETIGP